METHSEYPRFIRVSNDDLFKFSQLTEDLSTASTAAHERRNLLAPINRLPLDVLCLIPMHLASLSDRLRVTFVCRRWRGAFLQHAALWSQLCLTGGTERTASTLLGRVKGSPLDITVDYYKSPIHDVTLLSPFAQQIRSLDVRSACSDQVQELSTAIPGPLPLLHTFEIDAKGYLYGPTSLAAPTLPLFENAVNLKGFTLTIKDYPSLRHFTFPNLTAFYFWVFSAHDTFSVPQLLDFLEASPALQQIGMKVETDLFHEEVSPEKLIVLP